VKRAVNHITKFLADMAERNEHTDKGLWACALEHPELQKLEALDEDHEKRITAAVKIFVAESFTELVQGIFAQLAILLLEIKNQKDAYELDGTEPDIVKLEQMGGVQAEKFKMLVEIVKQSVHDVDWDYVTQRIARAGKKASKLKEEGRGDSNPFSAN